MKSFTVKSSCDLKEFTDITYPQGAFCLAALLRKRDVKVNGARVGGNVSLCAGDEVTFYTTIKQESMQSHRVVFEDDNILIADKLSGVRCEGLLAELCGRGQFFAVHRLDRNTQGLVVFAKTAAAEVELLRAFKGRSVQKKYIALCKNNFRSGSAVLSAFLLKDERRAEVKIFKNEVAGSVKIVTEYEVAESRGDIALVNITLHTGKTHQIRAHMAAVGCPVLGDEKYGDRALNSKYNLKRQCLIAKSLTFDLSGELKYLSGRTFVSSLNF